MSADGIGAGTVPDMELPSQIREAMVAHAAFCHPNEACGLLAADGAGQLRMAYCLTNADASPTRYTLDPTEHFRAMRHAESMGWDLAGVFHSHTHSAPYPSLTDVGLAAEPEWLYVVVGSGDLRSPEVRGYWIRDGVIHEEPLVPAD